MDKTKVILGIDKTAVIKFDGFFGTNIKPYDASSSNIDKFNNLLQIQNITSENSIYLLTIVWMGTVRTN